MGKLNKIKHIFLMITVILLLSGCNLVYINSESIDNIVNDILSKDSNLKSVSFEGYSYYLPQGVNLKSNKILNSVLYYNHKKMYLYVDLVSYYHKIENTYQENDAYYSKIINIGDKTGYLEINELENEYYVEFMYNYSKIEAYVNKNDLNKTLTVMAYVLNSVDYKDSLLDSLIGEGTLNYNEETFNIYKTTGNDGSNFLDIIEQYDDGRINSKDEDILDIENVKENLE